jgi:hypothetical protein
LAVKVADSLGYEASSEPMPVILRLERPQPPTPTPAPSPTPGTAVPEPVPIVSTRRLVLALGWSLLAGLVALVLLWRRWQRRRRGDGVQGSGGDDVAATNDLSFAPSPLADSQARLPAALADEQTAVLLPLTGDNVTIGRDGTAAQLVLGDKSVGRFHARIRWRDGRYWLYDEGSAGGTTLNFERLGLAPRPLQDGDQIQMGRLRLRFRLGIEFEEEE